MALITVNKGTKVDPSTGLQMYTRRQFAVRTSCPVDII